jgi:hypothetical protein
VDVAALRHGLVAADGGRHREHTATPARRWVTSGAGQRATPMVFGRATGLVLGI